MARAMGPNACGPSTTSVNVVTGHRYRGVNLFVLGMSVCIDLYSSS